MLRQRLGQRTSPLAVLGRLVTFLVALAIVWYGLMTLLLALKVSPSAVDSISGYRTAFDWLSGLSPSDVGGVSTRATIAGVGVASFLIFGLLAYKTLPRPYLVRRDLDLSADEHGEVFVEPRAIERLAEIAAGGHPAVGGVTGHYAIDDLSVDLTVHRARDLTDTLQDVQRLVVQALEQHELPSMPVNVTLTDFDRRHRRDLH